MRLGRLIAGGFLSRYGVMVELGLWVKPHYWLTMLIRASFGSAFFGLSGVEGGWVSYGIQRAGPIWKFVWSRRDKEKEAYIKKIVLESIKRRKICDL